MGQLWGRVWGTAMGRGYREGLWGSAMGQLWGGAMGQSYGAGLWGSYGAQLSPPTMGGSPPSLHPPLWVSPTLGGQSRRRERPSPTPLIVGGGAEPGGWKMASIDPN